MAQATRWVLPSDDYFSTPADPSKLYWICPPYHRFSDCVRKTRQEKLRAIVVGPKWTHRDADPSWRLLCRGIIFLGRRLRPVFTKIPTLRPSLNGTGMVALYVDRGPAAEKLTATKCHVASVLAPAVPNLDTDDGPGMTSEEESEDERMPNHLASVPSLTYQATHKKLFSPVTLDPTPEVLEA